MTPVGCALIETTADSVKRITLTSSQSRADATGPVVDLAKREIQAYFDGKLINFSTKVHAEGTLFQMQVWDEIVKIPFGETATYADIAKRIERPEAWRAVANACGANPVWLLIPCHRVVGSNGSLGGYNYGLAIKERLLAHEQTILSSIRHK